MSRVLVQLSGGIDSTVCLAIAIKRYGKNKVSTISFDYGQSNIKELEAVKRIVSYYNVSNTIMKIDNIFFDTNCSLIKNNRKSIPKISYEEQVKRQGNLKTSTNVPFRNGVMLSICTSYALAKNYNLIYLGIHEEEGVAKDLYPDCGEKFYVAMNDAIYYGTDKKVKIDAPLLKRKKWEIIKIGQKLDVPFELTWTCYEKGNIPCGRCCACVDRINGFRKSGIVDSIQYEGGVNNEKMFN